VVTGGQAGGQVGGQAECSNCLSRPSFWSWLDFTENKIVYLTLQT
jgi:hypothetical protein